MKQKILPLTTERQRAQAAELILNTPDKPKSECVIRPVTHKRSLLQNNRHWGILEQIAYWRKVHTKGVEDYPPEDWHKFFKKIFIGMKTVIVDGQPELIEAHSHDKTPMYFSEFDMSVEEWATDHDIDLLEAEQWQEYKRAAGLYIR